MSAITLKIKRLNKFQCGQLIFIFAITAGLFFGDTVRNILLLLSIFCMSKRDFTQKLRSSWTGKYKLYGYGLMLLWAMLLFIPFAFGVDDLKERFAGLGWPIEMIVWMWVAQVFARDTFFIKSLKNASIAVCGIYSLIAIPIVITEVNSQNYGKFGIWPLTQSSFATGAILCCLSVWMIYRLFAEDDTNKYVRFLTFCTFVLTLLTVFLTFRRTFWLAAIVELLTAGLEFLFISKQAFFRYIKLAGILCGGIFMVFLVMVIQDNPAIEDALKNRFGQISSISSRDVSTFTSRRNLVWWDAVGFIKDRPLTGYGFAEYENYTKSFEWYRRVAHSHSTFLQMVWTAGVFPCVLFVMILLLLLYICITELKKRGPSSALPFAVLLILAAFVTSGITEDLFKNTRRATTIYWIYLSLPLSKAFLLSISSGKEQKSLN